MHLLPAGLPRVMAIVNRTPDSFYDKGATFAFDAALTRCREVVEAGATIAVSYTHLTLPTNREG